LRAWPRRRRRSISRDRGRPTRSLCDQIFTRKSNQVEFAELSDLYGSGFIIDGNQIRGKAAKCTITSRKENGADMTLSAGSGPRPQCP